MSSKYIKGITIEIDGETKKLDSALRDVDKSAKNIQTELKQVERLLKLDPKNTELLAQKQKLLGDAVKGAKERLDALKKAQQSAEQAFREGKIGEDQYRAIKREVIAAEGSLQRLNKQLAEANNRWKNAADSFNKFGNASVSAGKKLLPVTATIAALGGAATYSAMELEATEAKYETVFGEFVSVSDAFIRKFKELTPATTAEARNMAAGIQDLLVPMGFMRENAANMTGELMHVIGALTNFNSGTETAESVTTKVNAALTGEYSSLKSIGIQLDVNTVKQKAVNMGLAKSTKEVTKQQQAQVLLAELYAQSGDALAAYTKENLDAKTKMALFAADAKDLGAEFGAILLPALSSILDTVREFIKRFQGMDEGTRKVIVTVGLLVAALGPVLIFIGKVSTGIGSIISLATKIGPVLTAVKAGFGLLTGPIGLVILAITALIAAGVLLWKNWDKVKAFASQLWGNIVKTFTGIKDTIVGAFNALMDIDLFEIGKNIILGLINGIKSMIGNVGNTLKNVAKGAIKAVKDFLGIRSPSKVFEQLGAYTGEGFVRGIAGTSKMLGQAAAGMGRSAISGVSRTVYEHTGSIRIEGVNSQGQFVAADEWLMDRLRKGVRRKR